MIDGDMLLPNSHWGWVTREGNFLGCGWAVHERMIGHIGMTASDAENAGWARISKGAYGEPRVQCMFRFTAAQARRIKELGAEIDPLNRTLPVWNEK